METGCQGGQGSPRAVAPGGWMGWTNSKRMFSTKRNVGSQEENNLFKIKKLSLS